MAEPSPKAVANMTKMVANWTEKAILRGEIPAALLTYVPDGTCRIVQPPRQGGFKIAAIELADGSRITVLPIPEDESDDCGN